jgi:ribonuclease G
MKSELVVDVSREEVSIALLEDSRLVSLQKESRNIAYAVGDLYLAKVKKLMPGLNAAFVDVGYEKDAFLHYLDLGPQFNTYIRYVREALDDKRKVPSVSKLKFDQDIPKQGTIQDVLKPGDQLLVQVAKEPISTKGPRLTTEISFTGRFMVLMPFGDKISISQKIKSTEEKIRLRQLIGSIKPKGFSVIVRTSAENKRVAELNNEMRTLLKSWEDSIAKMQRAKAPALVYQEDSRTLSMIRDLFAPTFENIHVNDKESYEQIRKYVSLIAPEKDSIVQLYDSEVPIFDHYNITRQIKSSFGKTVSFRSGAYLIIEHTEALHVIDVNSGNRSKSTPDQESNALDVNLKAADEIARQLRLRDMGGIIVVDFIDMAKQEHRQELYDHMREIMANDRARHNILPLSKFGLMQITRQRVRPALDIATAETCPSCFGKGYVQSSLLFTDKLEEKIEYLTEHLKVKKFIMYVHPYVESYIKKGLFSLYSRWRRRYGRGVKVVADESLAFLQYKVLDQNKVEIDLQEESDMNSSQTKNGQKVNTRNDVNTADETADAQPAKTKAKKNKQKQAQPQPQPKQAQQQPQPQPKQEPKQEPKQKEARKPQQEQKPKEAPQPQEQKPKEAPQPQEQKPKEAPQPQQEQKPKPAPKPRRKPQPKKDNEEKAAVTETGLMVIEPTTPTQQPE